MQPMWIPAVQLVQISLAQADDACARLDIGGGLEHVEAGAPRVAQIVIGETLCRRYSGLAPGPRMVRSESASAEPPVIEVTTDESDTVR